MDHALDSETLNKDLKDVDPRVADPEVFSSECSNLIQESSLGPHTTFFSTSSSISPEKSCAQYMSKFVPTAIMKHPALAKKPLSCFREVLLQASSLWTHSQLQTSQLESKKESEIKLCPDKVSGCRLACGIILDRFLYVASIGFATLVYRKGNTTQTKDLTSSAPYFGNISSPRSRYETVEPVLWQLDLVGVESVFLVFAPTKKINKSITRCLTFNDPPAMDEATQKLVSVNPYSSVVFMKISESHSAYLSKLERLDSLLSDEYLSNLLGALDLESKESKTWKNIKGFECQVRQKAVADSETKITKASAVLDCSFNAVMEILHVHQFHYYKALNPEYQIGTILDFRRDCTTQHIVFQRNGFRKKEFYLLHRVVDLPNIGTVVAEKSIEFIKFPKKRGANRIKVDFNIRVIKFISAFRTQVTHCFYIRSKKGIISANMTNHAATEMAAEQMSLLERIGTQIDNNQHLSPLQPKKGERPGSRSEPIYSSTKSWERVESARSHSDLPKLVFGDPPPYRKLERIDPDATCMNDFDIEGPDRELPRKTAKKLRPAKVVIFQAPEKSMLKTNIPIDKDPVYEYPLPALEEHLTCWDGRYCFGKLCAQEYAEEGLNCIVAIMEFSRLEIFRLKEKAETIYNCFLREEAPQKVNLTARTFAAMEERFALQDIKHDMFDQVKAALIHLLNQNIYIKYRRTEHFELWLRLKGLNPTKMREEWLKAHPIIVPRS